MTRCRRNLLGGRGLRCISSSLVVVDVPASPPPRSSTCLRKPHPRDPTYYSDRLLGCRSPLHCLSVGSVAPLSLVDEVITALLGTKVKGFPFHARRNCQVCCNVHPALRILDHLTCNRFSSSVRASTGPGVHFKGRIENPSQKGADHAQKGQEENQIENPDDPDHFQGGSPIIWVLIYSICCSISLRWG